MTAANSINLSTTGIAGFTGTAFTATPVTQYSVLIGGATSSTLSSVSAVAAGKMFQSGGVAANPSFSTATYPSTATGTGTLLRADGTNWVATTATYPNSTTSQQILYSSAANTVSELTTANSKFPATNAAGTLAMRAFSVVTQVFTATGTYTPTAGMLYCIIEVVGCGGGSGGVATSSASTSGYSAGGGGGEYARGTFSAATVGASQAVTIGAGGLAGTAGNNAGGTGGTCSVGALITAIGGGGGSGSPALASGTGGSNLGGTGGTGGTGGDFRVQGQPGGYACFAFGLFGFSGNGGESYFSGGAKGIVSTGAGNAGQLYGGGGGGASGFNQAAIAGTAGAKGLVVITEYVIA